MNISNSYVKLPEGKAHTDTDIDHGPFSKMDAVQLDAITS